MKKDKIVIGIDQSYTRTGITVLKNGKIHLIKSVNFEGCKTNTEKRNMLHKELCSFMWSLGNENNSERICICERIRLRSQGFINEDYIKATGALIATIIDTMKMANIPVYSVDTRAWKSAIVGTSKPQKNNLGIAPEKYPTIAYMRSKGLLKYIVEEYTGRGKKGVIEAYRSSNGKREKVRARVNDDVADSYCIASYGFLPATKQKLQEERF